MEHKNKIGKLGEEIDFWWKVLRAVIGACGLLALAWTQFLGPGIKHAFRDFTGIAEIVERLEFVERFMPPPRVVDWNQSNTRQLGECVSNGRCVYLMTGARTEYGENCGIPTEAVPEIRTDQGQTIQINYDNFQPVELTRRERTFPVPLRLDGLVPAGNHEWRTKVIYPTCPGVNEPLPRYTPWFPLTVSTE